MVTQTPAQHIVDNVDNKGSTLARTNSIRRVGASPQGQPKENPAGGGVISLGSAVWRRLSLHLHVPRGIPQYIARRIAFSFLPIVEIDPSRPRCDSMVRRRKLYVNLCGKLKAIKARYL